MNEPTICSTVNAIFSIINGSGSVLIRFSAVNVANHHLAYKEITNGTYHKSDFSLTFKTCDLEIFERMMLGNNSKTVKQEIERRV